MFRIFDLFLDLRGRVVQNNAVGVSVITDPVSFALDAAGDIRIFLDMMADHKKGGFDVCFFKLFEDLRSPDRGRTIVKGQGDDFSGRPGPVNRPGSGQNGLVKKSAETSKKKKPPQDNQQEYQKH